MRYLVTGRVHPERADVNISPMTSIVDGGGTIFLVCESSQLTVAIQDVAPIDGYKSAFILAEGWASTALAALGFSLGTGYSVELIQVVEEDGKTHVFGTRPGNLHFDDRGSIFLSAVKLAGHDLFFRYAIQDYVRAIRDSTDCAFYCYRAIEGISSAFEFIHPGKGWPEMHAALGTSRPAIESKVKAFADPVRHGNWPTMPTTTSAQRNEMLELTKDVLSRYLSWRAALPNPALNPTGLRPAG